MPSRGEGASHDNGPASSEAPRALIDMAVMAGIMKRGKVTGGEASEPSHARSPTSTALKGTGNDGSATTSDVPQLSTQSPVTENGVPSEKGDCGSVRSPSQLPNVRKGFAADYSGSDSREQTSPHALPGAGESSIEVVDPDNVPPPESPSMTAAPASTPEHHSRQRRESRHWTPQMKLLLLREVRHHEVFTGSAKKSGECFDAIARVFWAHPSTCALFKDKNGVSLRRHWDHMIRQHRAEDSPSNAAGSPAATSGDPDKRILAVELDQLMSEIAAYRATRHNKAREEEAAKARAEESGRAPKAKRSKGASNSSTPRGARSSPLPESGHDGDEVVSRDPPRPEPEPEPEPESGPVLESRGDSKPAADRVPTEGNTENSGPSDSSSAVRHTGAREEGKTKPRQPARGDAVDDDAAVTMTRPPTTVQIEETRVGSDGGGEEEAAAAAASRASYDRLAGGRKHEDELEILREELRIREAERIDRAAEAKALREERENARRAAEEKEIRIRHERMRMLNAILEHNRLVEKMRMEGQHRMIDVLAKVLK